MDIGTNIFLDFGLCVCRRLTNNQRIFRGMPYAMVFQRRMIYKRLNGFILHYVSKGCLCHRHSVCGVYQ